MYFIRFSLGMATVTLLALHVIRSKYFLILIGIRSMYYWTWIVSTLLALHLIRSMYFLNLTVIRSWYY